MHSCVQNETGTKALQWFLDWLERRSHTIDALPQLLVMENPPGVNSCQEGGDGEHTLRIIYRNLSDMGYTSIGHRTIHCATFGDPTMRRRVIIMAGMHTDVRPILLAQVC